MLCKGGSFKTMRLGKNLRKEENWIKKMSGNQNSEAETHSWKYKDKNNTNTSKNKHQRNKRNTILTEFKLERKINLLELNQPP